MQLLNLLLQFIEKGAGFLRVGKLLPAALILQRLGISAAVVHIDASHEYADVMRDAEEFWKILSDGGFLIGDDYHEAWPGVIRAAGEFSARLGRPMIIQSPKWILRKTK